MKHLYNIIQEKLVINKHSKIKQYRPKTKEELRKILEERLAEDKNANLNDIDVSEITDMGTIPKDSTKKSYIGLFSNLDPHNIDISEWDVSNVKSMNALFFTCRNLICDISKWNVSKVESMNSMFAQCCKFDCNLDDWDVKNVKYGNMENIFNGCPLEKNPPKWYKK